MLTIDNEQNKKAIFRWLLTWLELVAVNPGKIRIVSRSITCSKEQKVRINPSEKPPFQATYPEITTSSLNKSFVALAKPYIESCPSVNFAFHMNVSAHGFHLVFCDVQTQSATVHMLVKGLV